MTFLLDENFPKSAIDLLRFRGHDAIDIRDAGLVGADDGVVFDMAQDLKAVLLTTDRDFFHTIPHLYSEHFGVIVVALRQPNRRNILRRLEWFVDHFGSTSLKNKVYQLRDHTFVVLSSSGPGQDS